MDLERLRELFSYDPVTGVLRRRRTGKPCGSPNGNGYLRVNVNGTMLYAHRVGFALYHGYMPDFVDHRDSVRSHNWISNLRDCTRQQNNKRKLKRETPTTSRFLGVSFCKHTGRWRAQFQIGEKHKHIGRFATEEEAARAYDATVLKHNGEFSKTNYEQVHTKADEPPHD